VLHVSPLPPQRSGIADYAAELLPHLGAHVDLELVVDDGVDLAPGIGGVFPVHRLRRLPELLAAGRIDVVLFHLGNNRDYHAAAYAALLALPAGTTAVVVLHEHVLHHMVRDVTLHAGDPAAYVEALRWCYGRTGEALGRRAVATGVPLDPFRFPLFERAVDAAAAVIVHSRSTAARVLASRARARVEVIPSHVALDGLPSRSAEDARRALGLPADAFVVATFGFVTEAKRMPVLLRAFTRLRAELPAERASRARLLVVGEISPHYDFDRVAGPELRAGVEVTGRLSLDRFLLQMAACDVAVNLRHPTAGETSATLMRLFGLRKPVVVSRTGAFAEVPDGCCVKVDLDEDEEELLLAALRALAADSRLREAMGEAAGRLVAAQTPAASAAGYAELLRRSVAEGWKAAPCPPPLAPFPPEDLFAELARDTSAALADLGVDEGDEEALAPVARAMVELGLDRAGSGPRR
jgi:glycosyltransferase involved in cell wall biosynthesis